MASVSVMPAGAVDLPSGSALARSPRSSRPGDGGEAGRGGGVWNASSGRTPQGGRPPPLPGQERCGVRDRHVQRGWDHRTAPSLPEAPGCGRGEPRERHRRVARLRCASGRFGWWAIMRPTVRAGGRRSSRWRRRSAARSAACRRSPLRRITRAGHDGRILPDCPAGPSGTPGCGPGSPASTPRTSASAARGSGANGAARGSRSRAASWSGGWASWACREPCAASGSGRPFPARPGPRDEVNRPFQAPAPNRLRASDFAYVATWAGFVCVAFVIDTYARRIVGWRVSGSAWPRKGSSHRPDRSAIAPTTRWPRP